MKDVATPATQSEVRGTIKEALTKAALVNYERLSEEARIEGKPDISKNIHNLSIVDSFYSRLYYSESLMINPIMINALSFMQLTDKIIKVNCLNIKN